jgi:outer membrane lipoprotein-sorting protein
MKRWMTLVMILFLGVALSAQTPDAKEIVRKADEKMRGLSNRAEMKMTIIRPSWTREMTMKTWGKGEDYALVLVTAPARDKGTAFLKRGREMWNWQPTIDRVVKMPPSMMSQSWLGSDFKNDDLVQQTSVVNDFSHRLLGAETIEGRACHKIELVPREDAAVVWGKIIVWIDKTDYLELKTEFYDEDGYLVNTMLGKDIKTMGGRVLPARLEVIPADEPGHKTILEYIWIEFDKPMEDSFFSVQNMKRVK